MNICFVIENWAGLNPATNSTLRLIHEAVLRGHNVGLLFPRNLAVRHNVTYCMFQMFERDEKAPERVEVFFARAKLRKQRLPVKGFDVIMLRGDPPLDNLVLNFLDSVKDDTFIVNSIDGLRMANNKLYLTTFEDSHEFIPETHVSKDKEYLYDVIMESKKDKMILKPIAGFGGSGVILLEKSAMGNVRSLLDYYIGGDGRKNYVMVQEYVESPDGGDVRVFMLDGSPIGAMKRLPAEGDIRANVHAGGKVMRHQLTRKEKILLEFIGRKLVKDGLHVAGVDLMGEKLIEVNVISPGGIVNINRLNRVKLEKKVLDFIEQQYQKKESSYLKKLAYKKEVSGD